MPHDEALCFNSSRKTMSGSSTADPITELCAYIKGIVEVTVAQPQNSRHDRLTRLLFDAVFLLSDMLAQNLTINDRIPSVVECDGLKELRTLRLGNFVPPVEALPKSAFFNDAHAAIMTAKARSNPPGDTTPEGKPLFKSSIFSDAQTAVTIAKARFELVDNSKSGASSDDTGIKSACSAVINIVDDIFSGTPDRERIKGLYAKIKNEARDLGL
jgi:hypothetical protein